MADLTPEEMARLRVPLAEQVGLDPVGLRVYWGGDPGWSGLVLTSPDADGLVLIRGGTGVVGQLSVDQALRDLADAATRDRCARHLAQLWRAEYPELKHSCTAPTWAWLRGRVWELTIPTPSPGWPESRWWARQQFALIGPGAELPERPRVAGVPHVRAINHPEPLLDPADDRRLPDGSRWVDAAALAAVLTGGGR